MGDAQNPEAGGFLGHPVEPRLRIGIAAQITGSFWVTQFTDVTWLSTTIIEEKTKRKQEYRTQAAIYLKKYGRLPDSTKENFNNTKLLPLARVSSCGKLCLVHKLSLPNESKSSGFSYLPLMMLECSCEISQTVSEMSC